MDIQDLGSLGELIAAIATVATLFYVAKQIKDNSKQTQRNTATVVAGLAQDGFEPIYSHPENLRIWHAGRLDPESLDESELETFYMFMTRQLWNYENAVSAFEEGTYEEDLFTSLTAYYQFLLDCPGGDLWIERGDLPLREQTKKHLKGATGR